MRPSSLAQSGGVSPLNSSFQYARQSWYWTMIPASVGRLSSPVSVVAFHAVPPPVGIVMRSRSNAVKSLPPRFSFINCPTDASAARIGYAASRVASAVVAAPFSVFFAIVVSSVVCERAPGLTPAYPTEADRIVRQACFLAASARPRPLDSMSRTLSRALLN